MGFDFAYSFDWRTGFPFLVVNQSQQIVLPADRARFPAYMNLNLHVERTSSSVIRASDAFRALIDIGLRHGGSYYPTYHRYALKRQVEAAFPQFEDFLKLKRKYDPAEIFQSDWYRHYKKMFLEK